MDTHRYIQLQNDMAGQVDIPNGKAFKIRKHEVILSFDIQYDGAWGYVAVDAQSWGGNVLGTFAGRYAVTEEYQPGFFAFREGPLLLEALEDVRKNHGFRPSLLVVDGHGIAHPRKLGVASWLGVKAGIPSIGVAKEPLLRTEFKQSLGIAAGETVDVVLNGETVGYVLRTQKGVKPLFVSPGHGISLSEATRICMKLRSPYRVLEPIRRADQAARQAARDGIEGGI